MIVETNVIPENGTFDNAVYLSEEEYLASTRERFNFFVRSKNLVEDGDKFNKCYICDYYKDGEKLQGYRSVSSGNDANYLMLLNKQRILDVMRRLKKEYKLMFKYMISEMEWFNDQDC